MSNILLNRALENARRGFPLFQCKPVNNAPYIPAASTARPLIPTSLAPE
jgi:hypothetical protein